MKIFIFLEEKENLFSSHNIVQTITWKDKWEKNIKLQIILHQNNYSKATPLEKNNNKR